MVSACYPSSTLSRMLFTFFLRKFSRSQGSFLYKEEKKRQLTPLSVVLTAKQAKDNSVKILTSLAFLESLSMDLDHFKCEPPRLNTLDFLSEYPLVDLV